MKRGIEVDFVVWRGIDFVVLCDCIVEDFVCSLFLMILFSLFLFCFCFGRFWVAWDMCLICQLKDIIVMLALLRSMKVIILSILFIQLCR